jgi:hypothetical protein
MRTKKFKVYKSAGKVTSYAFWDAEGTLHSSIHA